VCALNALVFHASCAKAQSWNELWRVGGRLWVKKILCIGNEEHAKEHIKRFSVHHVLDEIQVELSRLRVCTTRKMLKHLAWKPTNVCFLVSLFHTKCKSIRRWRMLLDRSLYRGFSTYCLQTPGDFTRVATRPLASWNTVIFGHGV